MIHQSHYECISKGNKTHILKDNCTFMFIAALLTLPGTGVLFSKLLLSWTKNWTANEVAMRKWGILHLLKVKGGRKDGRSTLKRSALQRVWEKKVYSTCRAGHCEAKKAVAMRPGPTVFYIPILMSDPDCPMKTLLAFSAWYQVQGSEVVLHMCLDSPRLTGLAHLHGRFTTP